MIQLVVFDMAGTTVNEQNVVYKTVHRAIERAGYEVSPDTVLRYAAGKEKLQAIRDVLEHTEGGPITNDDALEIHRDFEQMLDTAYATLEPLPMPDAEEVFEALRGLGVKIALNTGYKRSVATGLLDRLGWKEGIQYDLLITADDVTKSRPHPDMIFFAMNHFGIENAADVAKIGDSIADIEEGRNAGCGIAAGITTGAQTLEQLLLGRPTHVFEGLRDILSHI
jgi:phosphonatase-like hydrolase